MTAKLLEFKSITKTFGGICALLNLSFHVDEGESLGLIGPNGAGKTTSFNLIMRELKQDKGEIYFKGHEISNFPTHERVKMGISRTYQIPRPFNEMTVTKNIRIGLMPDEILRVMNMNSDSKKEIDIAKNIGFSEKQRLVYPNELPMGDLRRLELARTIATNPKLLLLDEVFAGLTAGEITELSNLLKKKRVEDGLTYIIVSHDLKSLAPLVDRVVVVNFGEVIAEGAFEEVIADKHVKKAYLGT
jgi:ABC-type branched-subunit amino acid transport system ATPase component